MVRVAPFFDSRCTFIFQVTQRKMSFCQRLHLGILLPLRLVLKPWGSRNLAISTTLTIGFYNTCTTIQAVINPQTSESFSENFCLTVVLMRWYRDAAVNTV